MVSKKQGSKFDQEKMDEIENEQRNTRGDYDYLTKDYPFEVIKSKYGEESEEGATLYVPDYQREDIWNAEQKTKFIESILIGVPLTPFLVSQNDDGKLEIIDGSQRIRTMIGFHNNKFALVDKGIIKLKSLKNNKVKFKDLPKHIQTYYMNRDFKFIITDKCNDEMKMDIFRRVNTSGATLTDSEVRKGSMQGEFYTLISKLKDNKEFKEICPVNNMKIMRGEYEELILRFFAYGDNYLKVGSKVKDYLDKYLEEMNAKMLADSTLGQHYSEIFLKMVLFVKNNFPSGFKKLLKDKAVPRIRFEAISVGVCLAMKDDQSIMDGGSLNLNLDWLSSDEFSNHTTSDNSNGAGRLKGRVEYVRDAILSGVKAEEVCGD